MKQITFAVFMSFLVLVVGCNATQIKTDIQSALVFDDSAQSTFHTLATTAATMIPLLPADQQQSKRDLLTTIVIKGDQAFQAKEDALQAALLANQPNVDITQFALQIATVIEEIWQLASAVGVRADVLTQTQPNVARLKLQATQGFKR
jgi:hypothetical protein